MTPAPSTQPVPPGAMVWHFPAALLLAASLAVLAGGLNEPLFRAFNALGAPPWEALWVRWTVLGDGLVAFALLLPWAARRPGLAWAGLLAALLAGTGVQLLKELLQLPRPPAVLPAGSFHLAGPELRALAFPSGHTAAAFAVAGLLVMGRAWRGRAPSLLALATAAGVGLSRMAVGVHWPADVLAGAGIGWWCAGAGLRLAARRPPGPALHRALVLPYLVAAVALVWHHTGYPRDAALAAGAAALAAGLAPLGRLWRGGRPA